MKQPVIMECCRGIFEKLNIRKISPAVPLFFCCIRTWVASPAVQHELQIGSFSWRRQTEETWDVENWKTQRRSGGSQALNHPPKAHPPRPKRSSIGCLLSCPGLPPVLSSSDGKSCRRSKKLVLSSAGWIRQHLMLGPWAQAWDGGRRKKSRKGETLSGFWIGELSSLVYSPGSPNNLLFEQYRTVLLKV